MSSSTTLAFIKVASSIINFSLIMITGNLPIRSKAFKSSKKLISFANAFSGGLFLGIGILHLLPEAQEAYDDYYESIGEADEDHFPWVNFLSVACFAFLLFIERIAFDQSPPGHDHSHSHSHDSPKEVTEPSTENHVDKEVLQDKLSPDQQKLLIKYVPEAETDLDDRTSEE